MWYLLLGVALRAMVEGLSTSVKTFSGFACSKAELSSHLAPKSSADEISLPLALVLPLTSASMLAFCSRYCGDD